MTRPRHDGAAIDPADAARCTAIDAAGTGCASPAEAGAPLRLCTTHLLVAHDWIAGEVLATELTVGHGVPFTPLHREDGEIDAEPVAIALSRA